MLNIQKAQTSRDELSDRLQAKEIQLLEMQHRIANSLQLIASILLIKARSLSSIEARMHLHDIHERILSTASIQRQLCASARGEQVEITPYLTRLCEKISDAMVGEKAPISLKVIANGTTVSSQKAEYVGMIVAELVINALKHAFNHDGPAGSIVVAYDGLDDDWRLCVSDNGCGLPEGERGILSPGGGTKIVTALVKHLDGCMTVSSDQRGTSVSIMGRADELSACRVA